MWSPVAQTYRIGYNISCGLQQGPKESENSMQFNSWQFAVFLPIIFFLYYAVNKSWRWIVLLAASYFCYMYYSPGMVVWILGTTAVTYACGILMEKNREKKQKKKWLATALLVCLGALFFFKYFNFFSHSVSGGARLLGLPAPDVTLHLMMPIGISFYTFQTLAYLIDIYREKIPAERHLGYYALFVTFFPQLIAGPISRAGSLMPQLHEHAKFSYEGVTKGLKLMAWGYFKKLVIASSLAVYVDKIYDDLQSYAGFALLVAAVFYSIQIYCDFSGYSDIAIGCAKLFGKDLMINFKSPYFASSIKEFWGRWHISLSTWFRDYVYIPLGGNRVSAFRHQLNLLITFLVSGLWHGADWTFVIWGGVHGLLQVAESLLTRKSKHQKDAKELSNDGSADKEVTAQTGKAENRVTSGQEKIVLNDEGRDQSERTQWSHVLGSCARTLLTFILVTFAWIFFRADTLSDAWYVITNMFRNCQYFLLYLREGYDFLGLTKVKLAGLLLPVALLAVFDYFSLKMDVIDRIGQWKTWKRWLLYVAFVSVTICMVAASYGNVSQEFIYFQF